VRSLPVPFTFEQVAARTQQNAGALTARRRRSRPPAKRIDGGRDSGLVVPGAGLVDLTDQRAVGRTPDPTNGDGVEADGDNGAFSVDFTISGTAPRTTVSGGPPRGSDAFLREWERELGDSCRPVGNPAADFQVRSRAAKVRDVVIINLHGVSAVRSESIPPPFEEQVRMFVVRRGAGRGTVGATVATRPFRADSSFTLGSADSAEMRPRWPTRTWSTKPWPT